MKGQFPVLNFVRSQTPYYALQVGEGRIIGGVMTLPMYVLVSPWAELTDLTETLRHWVNKLQSWKDLPYRARYIPNEWNLGRAVYVDVHLVEPFIEEVTYVGEKTFSTAGKADLLVLGFDYFNNGAVCAVLENGKTPKIKDRTRYSYRYNEIGSKPYVQQLRAGDIYETESGNIKYYCSPVNNDVDGNLNMIIVESKIPGKIVGTIIPLPKANKNRSTQYCYGEFEWLCLCNQLGNLIMK